VEDADDEIDRTALLDHLRVAVFRLEDERPWATNPAFWAEHLALGFESLLDRPAEPEHAAALLARLRATPAFLGSARATVEAPADLLRLTALDLLGTLPDILDRAGSALEGASDDPGDAAAALTEARAAVDATATWLRAIEPDADPHGLAIGEAAVDRRLHHEHASIHNASEAWRGALRLATELEAEVMAQAAAIDPALHWRDLWISLREDGSGSAAEALAERLEEAERFAESHGLAAQPPQPVVGEISAAERVLHPMARYRAAAGELGAAILLGETEPPLLPWIAVRLGAPGIHLHRTRRDLLDRLVRRRIVASSTPLGHGLLAQEVMAELGFAPDPLERLAERIWVLQEVQLAVADLGLHTRQFTAAEAVDHLLGHTLADRATALARVRRIAGYPTSAAAALLGLTELRRLRRDRASLPGDRAAFARFQEELFGYGGLPVALIRWGMGLDA
jgi:hypothetical protein